MEKKKFEEQWGRSATGWGRFNEHCVGFNESDAAGRFESDKGRTKNEEDWS